MSALIYIYTSGLRMISYVYTAIIVCLCFASFSLCLFNLEELKLNYYEVDISKTPVKYDEEQLQPMLHIKSKYGQKYQCLLPVIEENESTDKKESSGSEDIDVKELLKPLENGHCLLKTKGWWTYEFCAGRYIKQYHIEDGKILGQVITLGIYQSDYDWSNETDESRFRHTKQRYHSQTYSNGSRCDLTGLPRSAEVKFYCEEDAGDYIYIVDEPGTCIYVLTVHTSRICSHPKLKPLPSNKAHTISCSPLLDEQQYAHYLQQVDEEKSLAEKKRHKFLTTQQERLKVMKSWTKDESDIEINNLEKLQTLTDSDLKSSAENNLETVMKTAKSSKQEQNINKGDEKSDEYIEKMLWKEYDRGIELLKSLVPAEKFSSVTNDIRKRIDSIIDEAEKELEGNLESDSKDAAFTKLATTLSLLLDKLDKAEEDVAKITKDFDKPQSVVTSAKKDSKSKPSETPEYDSAVFEDDKLHVRIRRLDRKSQDNSGELHEVDFAQRKQIEQAVKEKLEKSGLDTGGRRIEVKIITAGYYDNEDGKDFRALSDEETNQFQNMIMALLTGQQEAIQEMERHKKLEENYKFTWNNDEIKVEEDE